ncbi:MAG: SIMPL domain-containing protein [Planctomycetaceae bacterium]|nr:SIMPL domain-containing protein [Planctomycetaceae bacterium]MBT6156723.1 SIMPL domain-containing protein [Planctomycetaceae bacterium]MBT6486014.1 SIMPL domain-containing protein [Planctomycetaceae bacterium]MBT6493130.1 SIMPL domain-containing protein [Planctomycetaceae bacterium]
MSSPDSVRLFLEVITTGKTLASAREENASRVNKVREALVALKLNDLKSKTRDVDVTLVHAEGNDGGNGVFDQRTEPDTVIGYTVTHSFTVLIKESDPDSLNVAAGRVLDTALESGVNRVWNVSFFKEDSSAMRRQAMSEAVENAIANARAYAGGANVQVADVLVINGDIDSMYPSQGGGQQGQQGGFGGSMGLGVQTSFLAGQWDVTCNVRVICRF